MTVSDQSPPVHGFIRFVTPVRLAVALVAALAGLHRYG